MTKNLTPQDVIRHCVVSDPSMSVDEIMQKLEEAGLNTLTKWYVANFRGYVRDMLEFLGREGLLIDKQHELPACLGGSRRRSHQETNNAPYTAKRKQQAPPPLSKLEQAQTLLATWLGDGPMRRNDIKKRMKSEDISWITARRVKDNLPVTSFQKDGAFWWSLDDQ